MSEDVTLGDDCSTSSFRSNLSTTTVPGVGDIGERYLFTPSRSSHDRY